MNSCFGKHQVANDECYTTETQAEYVLDKYSHLLENKRIIMPCDCE